MCAFGKLNLKWLLDATLKNIFHMYIDMHLLLKQAIIRIKEVIKK